MARNTGLFMQVMFWNLPSTPTMIAILSYCFLPLLMISDIGLISGSPRIKQSYKQAVELPLMSDPENSDKLTPSSACPEPFFPCFEGLCIPPNWICDGEKDCDAGEDEDEDRCSAEAKNEESKDGKEAARPPRSPEQNMEPRIHFNFNSTRHLPINGSQGSQNESQKSSGDKKQLDDKVIKTKTELTNDLIRETAEALYSQPQIQRTEGTKLRGTSLKDNSHKKLAKSMDSSLETQTDDLSSESSESDEEPSCCHQKHTSPHYLEHDDEPQSKVESEIASLNKIEALTNITRDLLVISETLNVIKHSHSEDCIDKEQLEQKKRNIISKLTCPHHFQFVIGSCIYVQVYPPVTWQEASSLCQSHGGKLLTILSTNYYENLLLQMEHDKQRSYSFWIGATNSGGLWTWVDKTPFNSLSLWGFTLRKNSKNLKLSSNHPNQCAFLDGNLLSYVNGASCFEEKGFICKSVFINN